VFYYKLIVVFLERPRKNRVIISQLISCPIRRRIRPFTVAYAPYTTIYCGIRSVYGLRISSYTVTDIYDRNPVTWNPAKYGRIRSVYNMDTVVYGVVYDRLLSYTGSVTLDLGSLSWIFLNEYSKRIFLLILEYKCDQFFNRRSFICNCLFKWTRIHCQTSYEIRVNTVRVNILEFPRTITVLYLVFIQASPF
jgi:hypothetical protein